MANLELCSARDSLHDVAELLPPCACPIMIQEIMNKNSLTLSLKLHFKRPESDPVIDQWSLKDYISLNLDRRK